MRDLQAGRVISSCRHPGHVDLRAGQVVVVLEDGELLGVPEGHRAGHVDAEGLVSLLEAAHREELERVDVVAKVQPTLLSHLRDLQIYTFCDLNCSAFDANPQVQP